jgi:hypothetical protein
MKHTIYLSFAFIVVIGAGCAANAPRQEGSPQNSASTNAEIIEVDENGYTQFNQQQLTDHLSGIESGTLSDAERESLLYMREEEKLAHDVYAYLGDTWGSRVFENISSSELTHTNAVKSLLDAYGVEDVAANAEAGTFEHEELQSLYDDLTSRGSGSLVDALTVGAIIEEVDIVDLERYMEDVDDEQIVLVYENLLRGSRNHLRAFVRNLEQQGVTYAPGYLSEEAYQDIVSGDVERGAGSGGGNGGGRNR